MPTLVPMKVLVVEDDRSCSRVLSASLERDHHCDLAVDGNEGFSLFLQAVETGQPYDLICLDIVLPGMDGQELLTKIRRNEEARGISNNDCVKVVMITSQRDASNVLKAFREGCEAYVTKPLDLTQLREQLEKFGLLSVPVPAH